MGALGPIMKLPPFTLPARTFLLNSACMAMAAMGPTRFSRTAAASRSRRGDRGLAPKAFDRAHSRERLARERLRRRELPLVLAREATHALADERGDHADDRPDARRREREAKRDLVRGESVRG